MTAQDTFGTAGTAPIERRKLSGQIEERLLARLQSGELSPGDLLPSERELMELFGTGRPAVREAMQNLERMGLIEIRHGERPRVAEPSFDRALAQLGGTMRHVLMHSADSLEHLKEVRATFEAQMARIAARRATSEQVAKLAEVLERQERAERGSEAFLALDGEFHKTIAAMSGNPIFAGMSEALFAWLARFHATLVKAPGNEHLTLSEHRAILAAIAAGDADRAAREMADHLNRASGLYQIGNMSQ
ncbi:MAG: transcriptional regulator NanR [Rubellimicrobium sp.]|nr:transcriptional regulator NanR [Rubellimicrobium sp.]